MKKVALLFGGNSSEHLISCLSASSILKNYDKNLFNITSVGIDKDNNFYVYNDDLKYLENGKWVKYCKHNKIDNIVKYLKQFDVVFPIIHGKNGEDGKIQGLLDLFDIKYVGSNTLSSAIGMDKAMFKLIFDRFNIKQAPYVIWDNDYNIDLNYPVIVKPSNGGSSIGITKVNDKKQLKKAIKIAKKYDDKVIIEEFIEGREFECAVLQDKDIFCSKVGEIITGRDFYDYEAKYFSDSSKTVIPDLDDDLTNQIKEISKFVFEKLGCKSLARVDFLYDGNNLYLNEINTLPGFTSISMFTKLLINEGYTYKDIISILINNVS